MVSQVQVVIATRNPKKFRELKALLSVPGIRWRSLTDFSRLSQARETGRTFQENARKKALAAARATGCLAVADDSGLEVRTLSGDPGVRSARFAGRHGNDHANNAKLLRLLEGLPSSRRVARFRCVLVLASPKEVLAVTEGTLAGRIAMAPRGRRGFGYDPIFIVPRLAKTVAQLSAAVKNRISHRAQAARRLQRVLRLLTR
jgi:XTP/dITP diphosphohydrolase